MSKSETGHPANTRNGTKRHDAAMQANQEDAELWRWFAAVYEEGRIRWCRSHSGWLVSVDHKHLATEPDFDTAIRLARVRYNVGERRGKDPAAETPSGPRRAAIAL